MRMDKPGIEVSEDEIDLIGKRLPMDGARVLELGCGAADMTRRLVARFPIREIVATEVDEIQHAKNLAADAVPGIRYIHGGAESIDFEDDIFDFGFAHRRPIVAYQGSRTRHFGPKRQPLDQRHEIRVQEYVLVICMIDDIDQLLRKQPRVDGMTDKAAARGTVIGFKMPVIIPRQCRDPSALFQLVFNNDLREDLLLWSAINLPVGANGTEFGGAATEIPGLYLSSGPSASVQLVWYW